MKTAIVFAAYLLLSTTLCFSQTKTFKGAWFEVDYPSNFKVQPSMKSATSENGVESAFFTSPDKSVQFYVFSPQWAGQPSDISLRSNEKISSSKTSNTGGKITKWWTIKAKDGSYTRAYEQAST